MQDPLFAHVKIRPDGRVIHGMYLAHVKTPAQLRIAWDYYDIVATIPANEAFRPIEERQCVMKDAC